MSETAHQPPSAAEQTSADEHAMAAPVAPLAPVGELGEVRSILLEPVDREVQALKARVAELERLLIEQDQLANTVSEVLVDSVNETHGQASALGHALTPAMEEAVKFSARSDSTVLAEALYPVMGPAMRRMIANMFVPDKSGRSVFRVQQVLLIERDSGVLLAETSAEGADASDADMVSGMLDAIRLFVHEAFDTPEHDGLQDLRVGDTAVMVEWGPKAVLASVVKGIPTDEYRRRAARTLEAVHHDLGAELESFDGRLEPFEAARPPLLALYEAGIADAKADEKRQKIKSALLILAVIAVIVGLVWLIVWLV